MAYHKLSENLQQSVPIYRLYTSLQMSVQSAISGFYSPVNANIILLSMRIFYFQLSIISISLECNVSFEIPT